VISEHISCEQAERAGAWDVRLGVVLLRLEAFQITHGHMCVPCDYVCEDGFRLGQWVSRRKRDARHGCLHPRYRIFDSVPGWNWGPCHRRLIAGLERLRAYVAEHGTARVPPYYVCADGFRLGQWVSSRRNSPGQHAWLNEILEAMPCWGVSRQAEGLAAHWRRDRMVDDRKVDEELLRRLKEFRAGRGDVPVPRRYRCEDGFRLGERLRVCLAQEPPRHALLRRALAEEGVSPIRTAGVPRREGLAHLWGYVREHNTAWVPTSYVCADGFRLGRWVHRRRVRRGADPALDAQLGTLPGWTWNPVEDGFRQKVRRAQEAALAGHLNSERRLREWVGEQQRAARRGALDTAQMRLLCEAGLVDVHLQWG
jgi:hypothetical protein